MVGKNRTAGIKEKEQGEISRNRHKSALGEMYRY